MTEAEWLACEDPTPMQEYLGERASDRKLRLFTHACCRRIWEHLQSPISRQVVEVLELAADDEGLAAKLASAAMDARAYIELPEARLTETGCSAAYTAAYATEDYAGEKLVWVASKAADCARNTRYWAAQEGRDVSAVVGDIGREAEGRQAERQEGASQASLLRDIFGNPFRPAALDPAWRTDTVLALARGIYEDRAFDRMPILADALQEAGCDNEDVLGHCRGPGPHARGCWVVDLVLGKA